MFKNLKLRDRTLLGYSVPTLLIFILSGTVYFVANKATLTFRQVNISFNAVLGNDDMALSFANMDRRTRRYLLEKNRDAFSRLENDKTKFRQGAERTANVIEDAGQKEKLKQMLQMQEQYNALLKQTFQLEAEGKRQQAVTSYLAASRSLGDQFQAVSDSFAAGEQTIMGKSIGLTKASIELLSTISVLGAVISLLIAIIAAYLISRSLGSRITRVVDVADKMSEGDLSQRIENEFNSQDEIGQLLKAFQKMTQNLNGLVRQVQQSGIQVTTSSTQIAASGKQLEATMTEQVASTTQVSVTAKEIAATASELAKTMEAIVATAQSTTTAADNGQQGLRQMETTMRQLATSTTSISAKLGTMSEKANNINTVVTTITKVADQTNLLSLNAAIEAEKAGEYGLGFAVVAREIRRLADQTAVATLDIEQMVKEMQSAVSTGVMEMDKFTREMDRGVENVGSISSQVAEVIEQVQALTPQFAQVNEGMEMQSQGARQISEVMMQLSEASRQTQNSLQETNGVIEQLSKVSQNLRREISNFKVDG
ncbi:methyl-accepting chemotaxis protein (plasmid) [Phormidium sp. CLA17]|uniref:methyl-accepting chemotaxis protein n=1 Tax=Leptolyngbya sp. Cla-17 TaxID=2803751 RepID=UPI0014916EA0|nr:methyl-accepting chemotaxis protein [Leptolyngbya sp. Cla-17]MBM0745600.1 methyl-accepting chemotaxis protein [Leptolyngbya sp. Cla-17]